MYIARDGNLEALSNGSEWVVQPPPSVYSPLATAPHLAPAQKVPVTCLGGHVPTLGQRHHVTTPARLCAPSGVMDALGSGAWLGPWSGETGSCSGSALYHRWLLGGTLELSVSSGFGEVTAPSHLQAGRSRQLVSRLASGPALFLQPRGGPALET